MRCWFVLGMVILGSGNVQAGTDGKPPPHQSAARTSPAAVSQRIAKQRVAVKQLQRDVASQESASKQAGRQLQQQDQVIAELRKQLQATQAGATVNQH